MSSKQATEKARQTLKTMKELLDRAEELTHKALDKAAPAVQRSVDKSLEATARGFAATMKTIDGATGSEQLELLKAYRKFLGGQVELAESRIKSIEERAQARNQ